MHFVSWNDFLWRVANDAQCMWLLGCACLSWELTALPQTLLGFRGKGRAEAREGEEGMLPFEKFLINILCEFESVLLYNGNE